MKLVLQQLSNIKGEVKNPYLDKEAAFSLVLVERDTGGLVYTEMWRDALSSILVRRTNTSTPPPGYSAHNYGLSIQIDMRASMKVKKLSHDDLTKILERHGWFCQRRDEGFDISEVGACQFNYFGKDHDKYLSKASQDATSWLTPSEFYIWEKYRDDFQLETADVQNKLGSLGLYRGTITGQRDLYTREAIMAFQRTWEISQSGAPDMTLCRVLSFVTAELKIL